MTFEAWISFALLNFAYSLAPGPNAALIVGASARQGMKAGVGVLAGILLAEVIWALVAMAIVVGFLDLARLQPETFKLLGGYALVLIGASMLLARAPLAIGPQGFATDPLQIANPAHAIVKGGLVGITNPLALIFFVSIAPTFLHVNAVSFETAGQFTLAAVMSCAAAHFPYLVASRLQQSRFGGVVERACGMMLCVLGAAAVTA